MGTITFLWVMCMIIISTVIWIIKEEKDVLEKADLLPSNKLQIISFLFAPIIISVFIGGLIGLLIFYIAEKNEK